MGYFCHLPGALRAAPTTAQSLEDSPWDPGDLASVVGDLLGSVWHVGGSGFT